MSKLNLYRINHCSTDDFDVSRIFIEDYPRREIHLKVDFKARLFLTNTKLKTPEWLDYLEPILEKKPDVKPISLLGAVLLVQPYDDRNVIYAVTWGAGHFMLKPSLLEPNLGLYTALNLMCYGAVSKRKWDAERLRALRTKRVGANPLIMHSQFARFTTLEAFPFNTEADQVRSISGKPTDTKKWGTCVTGGTSLSVRSPDSPSNILELCRRIETVYKLDQYKDYFSFIDNIKPVSDADLISKLNVQILFAVQAKAGIPSGSGIFASLDLLTIFPPALIHWEDVNKFEFRVGTASHQFDEPTWGEFFTFIKKNKLVERLTPSFLFHDVHLHALNAAGERVNTWTVGSCISGEVRYKDVTYIIDEGAFYTIDTSYLDALNKEVDQIREFKCGKTLPTASKKEGEGPYINRVTKNGRNILKMHTATVIYKGTTPIEICDVALKNHVLIHIKRGTSSSSLSHLFAQATVSAELLHVDTEFRKKARERMKVVFQKKSAKTLEKFKWIADDHFEPEQNEIVLAIMTGKPHKELSRLLPFFSKVHLRMRCNEFRKMGYRYSVAQITN